jgi:hypothetical protein
MRPVLIYRKCEGLRMPARLREAAKTIDVPERQRIARLLVKEILVAERLAPTIGEVRPNQPAKPPRMAGRKPEVLQLQE